MVDLLLPKGVVSRALADTDACDSMRNEAKDLSRYQPIVHNDICLSQKPLSLDGQQIWIAGTGTD
jgi:hypothetical protein